MKFVCVGRNYAKHAEELGNAVPSEPIIFMKPSDALQTTSNFRWLQVLQSLHYECELVFRVGKTLFEASESESLAGIDAYGLGIDFTDRVKQEELKAKQLPWELAKTFQGSAYVSGWRAFQPSVIQQSIQFSLNKNGVTVQRGDSSYMIFRLGYLLSFVSRYIPLAPGDVVFTGTPEGVGPTVAGDVLTGYMGDEQVFQLHISAA